MSTFADTSALVKLYADEDGSAMVRGLSEVVVAQIARVEVPAALWRAHRTGRAPSSAVRVAIDAFEADYAGVGAAPARFAVVGVSDAILADATTLTGVHGLRAYDAVQLAAARAAARADDRVRSFAAFGGALREAAVREGFRPLP